MFKSKHRRTKNKMEMYFCKYILGEERTQENEKTTRILKDRY